MEVFGVRNYKLVVPFRTKMIQKKRFIRSWFWSLVKVKKVTATNIAFYQNMLRYFNKIFAPRGVGADVWTNQSSKFQMPRGGGGEVTRGDVEALNWSKHYLVQVSEGAISYKGIEDRVAHSRTERAVGMSRKKTISSVLPNQSRVFHDSSSPKPRNLLLKKLHCYIKHLSPKRKVKRKIKAKKSLTCSKQRVREKVD